MSGSLDEIGGSNKRYICLFDLNKLKDIDDDLENVKQEWKFIKINTGICPIATNFSVSITTDEKYILLFYGLTINEYFSENIYIFDISMGWNNLKWYKSLISKPLNTKPPQVIRLFTMILNLKISELFNAER